MKKDMFFGHSLAENEAGFIQHSVFKEVTKYFYIISGAGISVVLGAIISIVYDLNGKIYEVSGKQSGQYIDIQRYKNDNNVIRLENIQLKGQISILLKENIDFRKKVHSTAMQKEVGK
jgi:hypothetical protein